MRELGIFGSMTSRHRSLVKLITATVLGACALLFGYGTAQAAVTSVSVVSSTEFGYVRPPAYREVNSG